MSFDGRRSRDDSQLLLWGHWRCDVRGPATVISLMVAHHVSLEWSDPPDTSHGHSVCPTFFRSAARGLHMPARLTPEPAKHEARKRRASERPRVGCCSEELARGRNALLYSFHREPCKPLTDFADVVTNRCKTTRGHDIHTTRQTTL